jgi:hypothetical protein
VCYHHNNWTSADLQRFRNDLDQYATEISSLEEVAQAWAGHRCWRSSLVCFSPRWSPLLIRSQLKFVSWWRAPLAKVQSPVAELSNLSVVK